MTRANRITCAGLVWHITQRCHQRAFLLKFIRDRQRWVHWLYQARIRYNLSVLNYIVTSNHIHLLVRDQGRGEISTSMQLIAGRTAFEYNQRKKRRGAFWEDRYHATAVQSGDHLCRCLVYVDLNMVRAGVVKHPSQWSESGYAEARSPTICKKLIDETALCKLYDVSKMSDVMRLRDEMIDQKLADSDLTRNPLWVQAVAVGDEAFLVDTKRRLGQAGRYRQIKGSGENRFLKDNAGWYISKISLK